MSGLTASVIPSNMPPSTANERDAQGRIPSLDGFRGVACLMIVAYHFGPMIAKVGGPFGFLRSLDSLLLSGVDLFFVLSGFLIGGILMDTRQSPRYFSVFYVRRATRLLPLYYLTLTSYAVCRWLFSDSALVSGRLFHPSIPLWPYLLHLQNFAMAVFHTGGPGWLAATWSLAVEEQFYLLISILTRAISPQSLWNVCWVAWGLSLLFRMANFQYHWIYSVGSLVLLPMRFDALAMGIIVAYAIRYEFEFLKRWRNWWAMLTLGFAQVWLFTCTHFFPWRWLCPSFQSVFFGLTLLCLVLFSKSRLSKCFSFDGLRAIGKMSYSIYLLHPIILFLVFRVYNGADASLDSARDLVPLSTALVLVWVAGICSWNLVEKPFLRFGRHFQYSEVLTRKTFDCIRLSAIKSGLSS